MSAWAWFFTGLLGLAMTAGFMVAWLFKPPSIPPLLRAHAKKIRHAAGHHAPGRTHKL